MIDIFLGYLFSLLWLFLILFIGEFLIRINKNKTFKFIARKIIHILMCFDWFIMYHFFGISYHWIILSGSLLICLVIFYPYIKSISDLENKVSGSIIYASIATLFSIVCYIFPELFLVFGAAICSLSLGDGFAGLIGASIRKYNLILYKDKSLIGLICAVIFTFLPIFIFHKVFLLDINIVEIICISLIFGLVELISPNKLDNLTTSFVTACLIFLSLKTNILSDYFICIIIIWLIAIIVLHQKLLTFWGGITAFSIAVCIIYTLGTFGFLLLFSFFLITTICDLIGKFKKKKILKDMHKKVGSRDIYQVLAVGLLPCLCAVLYYFTELPLFIIMYVSLICENLGDSMASEIGVLSKSKPYDICRFKPIDAGLSGGVSLLGSIASIIGVLIISFIYIWTPLYVVNSLIVVIISAIIGVVIDSILGSLIQRKNKCIKCEAITEKDLHCEEKTLHYRGLKWVNNSLVNLFSNFSVIIINAILYLLLF